jgi:quinol monooxygenase YgiN
VIIVTAYMSCHLPAREEFLAVARWALDQSRNDDGCEDYRLFEDIDSPGEFVWVERWRDEASLMAHFHSDHGKEFRQRVSGIVTRDNTFAYEIAHTRQLQPD